MEIKLKITGMTCSNCVRHARSAIEGVNGVTSADVDLETGTALVLHQGAQVEAIIEAVTEEGYTAEQLG